MKKSANATIWRTLTVRKEVLERLKREKLRRSIRGSEETYSEILNDLLTQFKTVLKDDPEYNLVESDHKPSPVVPVKEEPYPGEGYVEEWLRRHPDKSEFECEDPEDMEPSEFTSDEDWEIAQEEYCNCDAWYYHRDSDRD